MKLKALSRIVAIMLVLVMLPLSAFAITYSELAAIVYGINADTPEADRYPPGTHFLAIPPEIFTDIFPEAEVYSPLPAITDRVKALLLQQ